LQVDPILPPAAASCLQVGRYKHVSYNGNLIHNPNF
jgi:hypothetical protein